MLKIRDFTHETTHWDLQDNILFHHNRIAEIGFSFHLPVTTLEPIYTNMMYHTFFVNLLRNAVPMNSRLRFIVKSEHIRSEVFDDYLDLCNSKLPISHSLTGNQAKHLREKAQKGEIINYKAYLTINFQPHKKTLFSSFSEETYAEQVSNIELAAMRMYSILNDLKLEPKRMTDNELFKLAFRFFNPDFRNAKDEDLPSYKQPKTHLSERIIKTSRWKAEPTLREQLKASPLNAREHPFKIFDSYVGILTYDKKPQGETDMLKASALLQHSVDFWLIIDLQHEPPEKAKRKLAGRASFLNDFNASKAKKGGAVDVLKQRQVRNAEAAQNALEDTGSHLYLLGISIVLVDENRKKLKDAMIQSAAHVANNVNMQFSIETVGDERQFFAIAPFSGGTNPTTFQVLDLNAADFIPYNSPWAGYGTPTVLALNDWDSLVKLDPTPTGLANSNAFICGDSGTGKSFTVQTLLANALKEDLSLFILDQKRDYETLVKSFGGSILKVSAEGGSMPNPFDLEDGQIKPDAAKQAFLGALISTIVDGTSAHQEGIISACIDQLYLSKTQEKRGGNDEYIKVLETPTLSDFVNRLRNMSNMGERQMSESDKIEAEKLANSLAGWTGTTPLGRFLDKQTEQRITNEIIYYDISELANNQRLQNVANLIVFDDIFRRVRKDKARKKIVVFEEVWSMLKLPKASFFITTIFKLIRAYNGSAWAITQDPEEFLAPEAQGIYTNTSIKYFLPSPKIEAIKKLTDLPDAAMNRFKFMRPKRDILMVIRPEGKIQGDIIRLVVAPFLYWMFTSQPVEANARSEKIKELGNIELALSALAEQYPNGLTATNQKEH